MTAREGAPTIARARSSHSGHVPHSHGTSPVAVVTSAPHNVDTAMSGG
ncbi:hypothetical protein [Salinifilum aidingensis]